MSSVTSTLLNTMPIFFSPLLFNISAMFGKIDHTPTSLKQFLLASGILLSPDLSPASLMQLIVAIEKYTTLLTGLISSTLFFCIILISLLSTFCNASGINSTTLYLFYLQFLLNDGIYSHAF